MANDRQLILNIQTAVEALSTLYEEQRAVLQHRVRFEAAERDAALHEAEELRGRVATMQKALEQIERGCSFPEDDVQRAIVKVARAALAGPEAST